MSFIFLEAKFGVPARISEAKFGDKPPQPPNMDVPPWDLPCKAPLGFFKSALSQNSVQPKSDVGCN